MQPDLVIAALGGADCERIGVGWLAQPANAVSGLAYVAVGVWLLGQARGAASDRVALVAAGTSVAAVGLGSAAYHGPQPAWAGAAHDGSIVLLGFVLTGQAAWRLAQDSGRLAAGYAVPCLAAFALLGGTGRMALFVPALVVAVAAAAVLTSRRSGHRAGVVERRWRVAGMWGVAALAAYVLGRTRSPLCRPDSVWQFHAAWHVLSAVGLGAATRAFLENSPAAPPRR